MEYKEVLYNNTYGGYNIPACVAKLYAEKKGLKFIPDPKDENCPYGYTLTTYNRKDDNYIYPERDDETLIQCFKECREQEIDNEDFDDLSIALIPAAADYEIDEYDGMESIFSLITISKADLLKGVSQEIADLAAAVNSVRII